MRRSGGAFLLLLTVMAAALLLLAWQVTVHEAAAKGIGVTVGYLRGEASLLQGEEPGEGEALSKGQLLMTPALLRVGQGTRLELVFPDKSFLRLAGAAMVLIREAVALQGERIIDMELSKGLAWLGIRPFSGTKDSVRLVLPASLVRTEKVQCEVRVGPDRRVMLAVFGGEAWVTTGRQEPGTTKETGEAERDMVEEIFQESDDTYAGGGPLDTGSTARILFQNETALLSLSGKVGEKRTMTPFEQRDSAWAAWNRARDAKAGLKLGEE